MKTIKRILVVTVFIVTLLLISYFIYTGGQVCA